MSQVLLQLEQALNSLNPKTAALLEQTVLNAIRLALKTESARDHSAFLNGYVPADEGLYDDCERR